MGFVEEELTKKIIDAAIEVHKYWGPGLLESTYEKSLAIELELQGIPFKRQVELKVVKELAPIHEAQLLTYMKLTHCRVGLLLNFNVPILKQGIKRLVL
jgi:hypothetical protein